MRSLHFVFLCLLMLTYSVTETWGQTDHWEAVITEGDEWRYIVPQAQPSTNWKSIDFDDTDWSIGNSGFGYGDGDDQTIIENTLSVYLRKAFHVNDPALLDQLFLYMDFDDGFVAYLNGVEIARELVSGEVPGYDQPSDGLHEATLYNGISPEGWEIDPGLINQGENILAVEVHNESTASSDMSAIPFLIAGISNEENLFQNTPWWFNPPLDFSSSDLPILVINTEGRTILDEPKVMATMGIIFNGEGTRNNLTDPFNAYDGYCGIEIRGNSSQHFAKRSYGIELWDANGEDLNAAFLNFPEEEDFVLHGPYADKTLMNNVLAMHLGTQMGQYASRTRFVELVLNDEYQGLYVIMEKIKRDNNRVDIAKLEPDENSGDDLTGGYIFRIDWGDEAGWNSVYNMYQSDQKLRFQFYYPDEDDATRDQRIYLQTYVSEFEEAVVSSTYRNSKGKHYTSYIDLRSFVDNFIINEFSKNVDAYRLSTYFHKDKDSKGGKIKAGPLWDFNLAFGNGDYCGGDDVTGWEYYQCTGSSPIWWHRMLQDTTFTNAVACRWQELRGDILATQNVTQFINDQALIIQEAQQRNFQQWNVLGTYLWPNPHYFVTPTSHEGILSEMKAWLTGRGLWMDENIPGEARNCEIYEEFNAVVTGVPEKLMSTRVYPVPARNYIIIESGTVLTQVRLINQQGQQLISRQINAKKLQLPLDFIDNAGVFILELHSNDSVEKRLIVLEKP